MMSQLFSPLTIRGVTLRNRIVVSPMCQYSAKHGFVNDWHVVHLGRFALGGFGLVFVEATAVVPEGRITYGCTGLWDDAHIAPLRRISGFLKAQGAVAGIQLAHAGRKASSPIPWRKGFDESDAEKAAAGFLEWTPEAPSALKHSPSYKLPTEIDQAGLRRIRDGFVSAGRRAMAAGFDVLEVHAAHGYLLNEFLSPVANMRSDPFGGSAENRMRFPLEVVGAVREIWPADRPLFVRISSVDALPGGRTIDDSLAFARALKDLGADVIDCSSGGFDGAAVKPAPHYQVPYATAIRAELGIATMAVGVITEPEAAESIIAAGEADLVALGRAALDDPNWAVHAARALGADPGYALWPKQAGYAVKAKDGLLTR